MTEKVEIDEAELAELRAKALKYDEGVGETQEMRGNFQGTLDAGIPDSLKGLIFTGIATLSASLSMMGVNDE